MSDQYISIENLKFLLHKVHAIDDLFKLEYYSDHNAETTNMVIDSAFDFSNLELYPYLTEMDRQGVVFENGEVKVHPQVYKVLNKLGESGFLNASLTYDEGGIQLPYMTHIAASLVYSSANNGGIGYAGLTSGAAKLIMSFGSDGLKKSYTEKMYQGIWQGTMAMTEPDAGSSLSDVSTKARPVENGVYKISGQKIFISGGDYVDAENIIHLMLARVPGSPTGTKGISLFVVPKYRIEENDELVKNDVTTAGIFHKLGQHAYVTTHLIMGEKDDCYGDLVGEENMGLMYMFQMMNSARIEVGLGGVSIASAAYYASLNYSQERSQGRHPSSKDPSTNPVKIIEHADVRRMLFMQKSIVEGCSSLLIECAKILDLTKATSGVEKENHQLLLELLTPIVKTYPTEMGIQAVSNGLQCLGGYGYCQDFPLEQLYRDIRITTLYEGTTGIQSMDLLGRKMMMNEGKAIRLLLQLIYETIENCERDDDLMKSSVMLSAYLTDYKDVLKNLTQLAIKGKPEEFLADANLFMELTGNLIISWQWLKQGISAKVELEAEPSNTFYLSKIETMRYYFAYELPKCKGLIDTLLKQEGITLPKERELLI